MHFWHSNGGFEIADASDSSSRNSSNATAVPICPSDFPCLSYFSGSSAAIVYPVKSRFLRSRIETNTPPDKVLTACLSWLQDWRADGSLLSYVVDSGVPFGADAGDDGAGKGVGEFSRQGDRFGRDGVDRRTRPKAGRLASTDR